MRDIIALWCGQPSEDKCPKCGEPYYPVMICPKCGYKITVTNVCRRCMVNLVITGKERHFCSVTQRNQTRRIKGYKNTHSIYELP